MKSDFQGQLCGMRHAYRRQIRQSIPRLRRFARAMTGDRQLADWATLKVIDDLLFQPSNVTDRNVPVELFRALRHALARTRSGTGGCGIIGQTPLAHQALLLAGVEGFANMEISRILGVSIWEVPRLIAAAAEKSQTPARPAQVLIIEDEPIVAWQLESIVQQLGHHVVGVASSYSKAMRLARQERIDLVLTDVQLADNKSGIDAVSDIQDIANPATIVLTACPEKTLDGEDGGPLFLIEKPFQPPVVRVTIAQALLIARTPTELQEAV